MEKMRMLIGCEHGEGKRLEVLFSEYGFEIIMFVTVEDLHRLLKQSPAIIVCDADFVRRSILEAPPPRGLKPFAPIILAQTRDAELARICESGGGELITRPYTAREIVEAAFHAVSSLSRTSTAAEAFERSAKPLDLTALLRVVGFPPHLDGSRYIKLALEIGARREHLYSELARRTGSNEKRIERSLRYAVRLAWKKDCLKRLDRICHTCLARSTRCPTSTEVIATLAETVYDEKRSKFAAEMIASPNFTGLGWWQM